MRDSWVLNLNVSRLSTLLRYETKAEEMRSQREQLDYLEVDLIYYF
jgi:hypothetical protein